MFSLDGGGSSRLISYAAAPCAQVQEYKKKAIEEEEKKLQALIDSGAFVPPRAGGEPNMIGAKDDDDLFS